MNAVTTGFGVSGNFTDTLETLIETLRADTGDLRWHLHMQLLRTPEYSVRVYAPDRHSQLHTVRMTGNTAKQIKVNLPPEVRQTVKTLFAVR